MKEKNEQDLGRWVIGGGLLAGLTASMCCIGPALFVLLGLGSFTAAAFFASLRPFLIGLALVFLLVGWYRTFFRKIACAADGSCDLRLSSKSQKVGLVLVTVLIGGFIAYPQLSVISMKLADNETAADPVASVGQNIVAEPTPVIEAGTKRSVSAPVRGAALEEVTEAAILEVDIASMTCPACAYGIEKALVNKPGVKSVSIDYANKSGRIRYDEAVLTADQLIAAIDASGFKAERRNQETGAP